MIKYALRVKTEADTARFLQNNVYLATGRTRPEFQVLRWAKTPISPCNRNKLGNGEVE
jgi:hypothetical protein